MMLVDTFWKCVPITSTMSSVANLQGRWYSVTLKFSCSFFSCEASKMIEVFWSTLR